MTRAWFAALALALAACSGAAPVTIPSPSLAGVESEVAEAIQAARAAVEREPSAGKAWGRLGDHYFTHDFKAEAAACYEQAEVLDPASYLWPYRRGWCLLQDRPELAVVEFEEALRSLDSYAPAHDVYAKALARLGRNAEALVHYARAKELDPTDADADAGLGLVCLAQGDFERAGEHLEQALARNPRHIEAHAALALVALALGQDKKAQRHAELARTLPQTKREADAYASPNLAPLGARGRTRAGQQMAQQGQTAEAIEQFRAALKSNPDYYLARRSLANLLVAGGQRDEALALLREAEKANPDFERVRRDIERLSRPDGTLTPGDEDDRER